MKTSIASESGRGAERALRLVWIAAGGLGILLVVWILAPVPLERVGKEIAPANSTRLGAALPTEEGVASRARRSHSPAGAETGEVGAAEIVAKKVGQFARNRREMARRLAREMGVPVPEGLERFFDAVEAGRWDEVEESAKTLREELRSADLLRLWPPAHEAWGVVGEVRKWPAGQLLEYGNSILDSLRPGMIYVGGTDPGRWIPTLLNETGEGERRVVLTQNALADATYLDYIRFQYGDRLSALTGEDSERAFREYLADAQARLRHDQEFPREPKQLRAGEDVRITEGRVQVSGQIAVMSINEKLLGILMEKNPNISFGVEESFPFRSTYADAVPLGPIMELRSPDARSSWTPERATEAVEFWKGTADRVFSDPEASSSAAVLRTYSHDAVAAANLLAAHDYSVQAEQAYRLSIQLWPGNPEAVSGLWEVLARTGRAEEARGLFDAFVVNHPDQRGVLESMRRSWDAARHGLRP